MGPEASPQATLDREPEGGPIGIGRWQISHLWAMDPSQQYIFGNLLINPRHDADRLHGESHFVPYRLHQNDEGRFVRFGLMETKRLFHINLGFCGLLFPRPVRERWPDRDLIRLPDPI